MKVTSRRLHRRDRGGTTLTNVRKNIEPYGVEIMRFGDFSVTMDQNDKERLDKLVDRIAYVSNMGQAPGGMAAFQQLAQAEMMMGAAEGMKKGGDGGGAFQGAGIGMGFAMAGNMAGQGWRSPRRIHRRSILAAAPVASRRPDHGHAQATR